MGDEEAGEGRLPDLFERLKITRVVFVDDMALPEPDAGAVQAVIAHSHQAAELLADLFAGIDLSLENPALVDQVSVVIGRMDAEELEGLRRRLAACAPESQELQDWLNLQERIPDTVTLDILTPERWAAERDERLAACSEESRTLFLFDQELNGDRDRLGFVYGTDIIRGLSASDEAGFGTRWFCGLLSNKLVQGKEVESWKGLAAEHGVELKFFMPIAKGNLQDGGSFFGAVYRTVINTYCETMKKLAVSGFRNALDAALKKFDELDPIDFEHMIVGSSEREGVSELDTLVRLYGIMHKDEVRARLLEPECFLRFTAAASAVKEVADIDRELTAETRERLNKLRMAELYDPAALLNGTHEPLANGDLFDLNGAPYVLMAQPCDLMVRSGGDRGREANFKIAFIAKLSPLEEASPARPDLQFVLHNFGPDGGRDMKVEFVTATPANLHVLDLAVLSADGNCAINPEELAKQGLRFPTRSWERRIDKLSKHFNKVCAKIEDARAKYNDEVAALLAKEAQPRVAQADALKKLGSYDKGLFDYPIQRIGRIRQPAATSMLSAFGRYLARDAYDHDFAKPLKAA